MLRIFQLGRKENDGERVEESVRGVMEGVMKETLVHIRMINGFNILLFLHVCRLISFNESLGSFLMYSKATCFLVFRTTTDTKKKDVNRMFVCI